MKSKAPTQTETDGVQYRRVSNARLALAMTSALSLACFFSAIGYVSYAANLGFGVTMLLVGTIMTVAPLFDGITDPLISLLIDKVNTRFGKIRLFIIIGWAIEAFSLLCLYSWFCGKGHSVGVFILFYFLYYIGYTFHNMANNLISPVITNDPKQRPMVGVFSTIYNYVIVIVLSIIVSMVLLPQYGDNYTVDLLSKTAVLFVGLSAVFTVLAIIGVSPIDKPENFTSAQGKSQSIKGKDMLDLLKNNKALQCFIFAATSDKLAMNIAGQSVITTLLYGIIIGNVRIGAIMNMVAIFPALIFSVFGGKYTGKHGSAKGVAFWSQVSIYVNLAFVIVLLFAGTTPIVASAPLLILFIVLTMLQNGLKVVVSTATTSMLADVVDYEAYRSGRYMPGVVAGVYSLVDKVVSSLGAVIATFCISLIGYTATIPQPTDPKTMPVVIMGILVVYVLPVLGWICTLIAMKKTPISKEKMVEIQKTIGERKKNAEQIDA